MEDTTARTILAKNITDTVTGTLLALRAMNVDGYTGVKQAIIALRTIADTLEKGVLTDSVTYTKISDTYDEALAFHKADAERNT